MNGLLMMGISVVVLAGAYLLYGCWLARTWGIDEDKPTPAHVLKDGVDYVPAKKSVVFGHEFASIAGAGPINGPIIAAMFGWVPVLLWILIGGIFFGAVQDFASLYASVKNKGKSIGYIVELYIGRKGKILFLLFVWLFSILVVAAFADIVAETFAGFDVSGAPVYANASVAATSLLFIAAAIGLGVFLKTTRHSEIISAVIAIGLLIVSIALGLTFPIYIQKNLWLCFVFAYIFVASITPVWILLQPRDYLNSFLLLAMMLAAFVGIATANPEIKIAPFTGFEVNGNHLFPILFVTIACGAVSGFHSLVASGTASKQIDNERDMLPIGFGAMLLESFLAILALICVGSLATGGVLPEGTPPVIFATAIAGFLQAVGLPSDLSYTLITLAISAFALTSLDSVARVGRLSFQELFIDSEAVEQPPLRRFLSNKYVATAATLILGFLLSVNGYEKIWPLFGSANQLLASLTFIVCAVFFKKTKRKNKMLYIPMVFMFIVTAYALLLTIFGILGKLGDGSFVLASDGLQLVFAVLLLILGFLMALSGIYRLKEPKQV